MDTFHLLVYGLISFVVSTLTGMAGGGGGFILTPLLIFLGLSPAQSVATGKLGGLAVTLGSLKGLRKAKLHSWRIVIPLSVLTLFIGLTAPLVIKSLESAVYRKTLGILLILMIPIMLYKRVGHVNTQVTAKVKAVGYVLLAGAFMLQAIFSGGMGVLVNIVMMTMLGMSALEANVTKRFAQVILNSVITLSLIGSHLIIWEVAAVGFATSFVGGIIGAKLALKHGDKVVANVMIVFMFLAALELLFGH